jgi:hypothetical protein
LRARDPSPQEENSSAGNLVVLQNAIGYLKHAYNVAYAKSKFSGDLADTDGISKEKLVVVQLARNRYSTHTVLLQQVSS